MELQNMSAEEVAQHFSTATPSQANQPYVVGGPQEVNPNLSSEELAAKGVEIVTEKPADGSQPKVEGVKPETEKVETKTVKPAKEKLDDSFKAGLTKLFASNKLAPFGDGTEQGYLTPETWEDVEEVIEENKKTWIEEVRNENKEALLSEIIGSKSPAWQFLIQSAEKYRTPEEMLPLISAVNNQEQFNNLDPENTEHQEFIIRSALSLQGLSPEVIQDEIVDLKDRGKIEDRAKALKPVVDTYNEQQTNQILQRQQQQEARDQEFWNQHYGILEQDLYKAKDIDGVKLKGEHRDLIASTLLPDQKLGGLPIYTLIDQLVAQGDIKRLSKISLMAYNEELYNNYFLAGVKSNNAAGLQKKLREQGNQFNTTDQEIVQPQKTLPKKQYGYFG